MIRLAFYKGRGTLWNRLIRVFTQSPYSHVELVISDHGPKAMCWSSSHIDGGVRSKRINLHSGRWFVVDVPWANEQLIHTMMDRHNGQKYDWLGVFFFPFRQHRKKRWFCSEICAKALDLEHPHRYSPARLFATVININVIFTNAKEQ